jgi:hypothetical protein
MKRRKDATSQIASSGECDPFGLDSSGDAISFAPKCGAGQQQLHSHGESKVNKAELIRSSIDDCGWRPRAGQLTAGSVTFQGFQKIQHAGIRQWNCPGFFEHAESNSESTLAKGRSSWRPLCERRDA